MIAIYNTSYRKDEPFFLTISLRNGEHLDYTEVVSTRSSDRTIRIIFKGGKSLSYVNADDVSAITYNDFRFNEEII